MFKSVVAASRVLVGMTPRTSSSEFLEGFPRHLPKPALSKFSKGFVLLGMRSLSSPYIVRLFPNTAFKCV